MKVNSHVNPTLDRMRPAYSLFNQWRGFELYQQAYFRSEVLQALHYGTEEAFYPILYHSFKELSVRTKYRIMTTCYIVMVGFHVVISSCKVEVSYQKVMSIRKTRCNHLTSFSALCYSKV